MANLTIKQKKEWAELTFMKEQLSQKEIALRVGVSPKTISKWIKDGNWEQLKASKTIGKEKALNRLYAQINMLSDEIDKKQANDEAIGKEAAELKSLSASVKSLETDISVSVTIDVFEKFLVWLKTIDLDVAKSYAMYKDNYIKTLLK